MKKILCLLVISGSGFHAKAQNTAAESATPVQKVSPVPGDKIEADTAGNSAVLPSQKSEYQVIDGRKVKVDSQGVQSLEVVEPVPVAKPAAKENVQ